MKQADIEVGATYVLGRRRGSKGIESTGVRIEVIEKNVHPKSFFAKHPLVRVVPLNPDGTKKVSRRGFAERLVSAQEVISLKDAEEQERIRKEVEQERTRRYMLARQLQTEIEELVADVTGITNAHAVTYFDVDANEPRVNYIQFTNRRNGAAHEQAASTFVAWLRSQA